MFFPWPFGGGFFIFTCFFTAMFFRDFSFSLVFCRDLRGAKAASEPPASSPFYGENHAISGPRTPPKNKWKNDGMTGKNKCPKPPKKQAPALLVKLRRSAGTPCRGRTQPAKSSKAVPPRLTLKKSRDEPAVLELVRDTNVKMCSVQQDDRASV